MRNKSKVYNKSKQLVEVATIASCPRCKGHGASFGDEDACKICKGYGAAWVSESGWTRAKYTRLDKSQLY